MKNLLKDMITCPACQYDKLMVTSDNIQCEECFRNYSIENGVPVLLSENKEISKKSEIHRAMGSEFNYIEHYHRDAIHYDYFQESSGAVKHHERRLREYIVSQVRKEKGIILDVGCGNAWVARTFCPAGYPVISFDLAIKNTSEAIMRYPFENHAAVTGDVFSLPFRPGSFDIIIASEIIEHVTEPALFVVHLFRLLKPGGTLIISTPYKEKIEYSLCIHCNQPTPKSAHLHSFDENSLLSYFEGLEVTETRYYRFANKALIHLRTHPLLQHFGFISWKFIDQLSNRIYRHPLSILVYCKK